MIGAGRVGTALAVLWERAGHRVVAASGRRDTAGRVAAHLPSARFLPPAEAARGAQTVVLAVPDDYIVPVCAGLADGGAVSSRQRVLHLSGSVGLDALASAEARGAEVLSLHPLQSFPDVDEGIRRMPGSAVAVTAQGEDVAAFGDQLARDAGGVPFRLADEVKPLYHAAAVFCSNYLVTVEAVAERLFREAGVDDPLSRMAPLARTAFDRTLTLGPAAAITGPAVRGDVGTIRRNLQALAERAPDAVAAYAALARLAASTAAEGGRLGQEDRARVEEALDRWK